MKPLGITLQVSGIHLVYYYLLFLAVLEIENVDRPRGMHISELPQLLYLGNRMQSSSLIKWSIWPKQPRKEKCCYPFRKGHFKAYQMFSICKVHIGLANVSEQIQSTQKKVLLSCNRNAHSQIY